jgi:hypothetical protein
MIRSPEGALVFPEMSVWSQSLRPSKRSRRPAVTNVLKSFKFSRSLVKFQDTAFTATTTVDIP